MAADNSHRDAAEVHEQAAEAHAESAVFLDDHGDPELADLERRSEEVERESADIALERARLSDDRGMRERLRVFFDGEER